MILSDDHKVVIPTATKTGTFSLESAARSKATTGFTVRMPRHSPTIPPEWHGARVLFMVRDPYQRLVSMYRYGIVHKHSLLLRWGVDGFETFCQHWAAARDAGKSLDWTMLYSDYIAGFRETNSRVKTFRLEGDGVYAIMEELRKLYPDAGLVPVNRHINRSADKFDAPWRKMWTAAALRAIGTRVIPDLAWGDYEVPGASRHVRTP